MKHINIINACTDLGVHVDGAQLGPTELSKILKHSNINETITLNYVPTIKEKNKINKRKNILAINEFNEKLYTIVDNTIKSNLFPLTIGGDHSLVIASGLASIKNYSSLGVIWVDAHGDYNTFDTTISGNIHGLPLAVLDHYEKKDLAEFHHGNFYKPENTVIVGARDLDPLEIENLKDAGVTIFTTEDIHKHGADNIMRQAYQIANNNTNGVHVSYDIDVIDPKIAPGVSIPAGNGINLDEAYLIVDMILKHKNITKSIDVVEYNPLRDIDNKTKNIAYNILQKIISSI